MSDILAFSQIMPESADLVGGKGLGLGLMANAGLPVPPGFCVTSAAYRRHASIDLDSSLLAALSAAYRELGGGALAVRSSATAEDGAVASFAGQQETVLGVEGDGELQDAVERCWRSLHTDRAKAYRERQGVDDAGLAMAVVVQRLVDADVAGVMFTHDPLDPTGKLMRIEASWGLGEVVVSGKVTPDRFQVDRQTGIAFDRQAGCKHVAVSRAGEQPVPRERQNILCLTDEQIAQLAELGRQVEAFYGDPRDIEWAIAGGRVWLLQARPITTVAASDREHVRRETIERLAKLVEPGGTVWSRTNLVEVLAEPTPMTWAIISTRLLSGGGGTGAMYRDFGFRPDPAFSTLSAYDLIGGRPYLNLSREPRLEDANPLAGYPMASYKMNPELALDPKREEPHGLRKWLRIFGMLRIAAKIASASKYFAAEFRARHIPEFAGEIDRAVGEDLTQIDLPALVGRFEKWVTRTLVEFARQSLKPTLLAQFSWQVLEQQIAKSVGVNESRAILSALSQGAKPEAEADLPSAIRNLAAGTLSHAKFLEQFGHRGPNEMELSSPRWAEDSSALAKLSTAIPHHAAPAAADVLERVAAGAKWNAMLAKSMAGHVERLQTYLGLRETGKHYLMRGYAEIRRTLLELDRRFGLGGGIFYLTPEEIKGSGVFSTAEKTLIAARRKRRALELSLETPAVIFGDDLDAIGRPSPPPAGAEEMTGIPLSAGVAEGPALVLTAPAADAALPGYILVCPSTDPAWVPLFVNARGLVMESGGTLSHGAIVAREFGLPAIAGLPGVLHRIKTGQTLRIDGGRGILNIIR